MANVLKRFIRQLDEPLLTEQLREGFLTSANIEQVSTWTCELNIQNLCLGTGKTRKVQRITE